MNRSFLFLRTASLVATGAVLGWADPSALLVKASPVPGGVAVVPIQARDHAPKVTFRGEPVLVRHGAKGWVAVVGIPLSTKPGAATVEADGHSVAFTIKPKRYPEQRVKVEDQRKVTPNAEDEARIAKEQLLIAPAKKAWPEGLVASLSFRQPTPGSLSASFGMRRIFNGEPRSPHSGLDIRAPQGQVVRAPAAGKVVLTGDFFYSGNSVFVAHGEGVVSLLCHLSKINVKAGQAVQAGEVLGEVGMTGRASGPHLHWSLGLNNAWVDPRLFLGGKP